MSLLSDEFMTKRLRANGLPVVCAIRHHEEQKWTYYLAGGLALDVPYSVTECNLSPTIVEWVRDQIDPSPWTIDRFIACVSRAADDHGGTVGAVTMTHRDWARVKNTATNAVPVTSWTQAAPSTIPPGAEGVVYGVPVMTGERTSWPCADGTDLAESP